MHSFYLASPGASRSTAPQLPVTPTFSAATGRCCRPHSIHPLGHPFWPALCPATKSAVPVYRPRVNDDSLVLSADETIFAADSAAMQYVRLRAQVRVPLSTIDKLLAELAPPRVDFIKLEIKGAKAPTL